MPLRAHVVQFLVRELKMKLVEKSLKRWRRGKLPLCIAIALCRIAELHEKRKKKSNKVLLLLTPIIILLVLCTASFSENWMRQQREEENCSVNNCPEEYMNGNKLSEAFYICAESGLEKLLLYRIMNRNARSRLLQFPLSLFSLFFPNVSPRYHQQLDFSWCYCYDTKV